MKSCESILEHLKAHTDKDALAGMARFGINTKNAYGVPIPMLRKNAKDIGKDHALAMELWSSGIHDARILATMIDSPGSVTEKQMEDWVKDFDSWDVCDQCCSNLFSRTQFGFSKAVEWSSRAEEFVKRAGFALMAALAVHDKKANDEMFVEFLSLIKNGATDERNFVKKAVNWALRQIGKRNKHLNEKAIDAAKGIMKIDSRSARWIATDALKELESENVQKRLEREPKGKPAEI